LKLHEFLLLICLSEPKCFVYLCFGKHEYLRPFEKRFNGILKLSLDEESLIIYPSKAIIQFLR